MPAPTSYAGPRRNEGKKKTTYSQTPHSNLPTETATVRQLLDRKGADVFSVRREDSMRTAVDLLKEKRIGALLVVSAEGALEGILSERDIVRKLSETPGQVLQQKVEALMTHKVESVSPQDFLLTVIRRMTEGRFRHMPVVQEGALVGVVTIGDVVNFRLQQLEYEAIQLKQIIVG